ncbi:MAG: monovalent cation/H(+) antiporter subunit G [Gemmatimonadetes bacterium]|nr:monovalent cation/H(+) antiporter subunit G [Gemmatimonadota bacterium]
MMDQLLSVLTWALLLAGSFFFLTGALGMVRLPDVFTRMHAAGMGDTMGAGLILLGLCVQGGVSVVTVRLVLVLAFVWFTSPIATHALAKAALSGGTRPYTLTGTDAARGDESHEGGGATSAP